jgi:DNA-binding transcriptional ArsR family regulator
MAGEKAAGALVNDHSMSQPQVPKHLRALSEVGLVRCPADAYLQELQHKESGSDS